MVRLAPDSPDTREQRAATGQDAGGGHGARHRSVVPSELPQAIVCPFCASACTEPTATYGSHMMTAQYYCRDCRSSFDWARLEST